MKKLFSKNGAFTNKAMIVGVALAVVVTLSYFGSSDYLGQSTMDMLMGGTVNYECKGGSSCPMSSGDCDFFENSPATSDCQHYPGSCKTGDDGKCTAA